MKCVACGNENDSRNSFCVFCGQKLLQEPQKVKVTETEPDNIAEVESKEIELGNEIKLESKQIELGVKEEVESTEINLGNIEEKVEVEAKNESEEHPDEEITTENHEMAVVDQGSCEIEVQNNQVDGIILIATVFTKQHKKLLQELSIPVVIVGQYLKGYSCIYNDDYNAAKDITKELIKDNRKNPGYIGVNLDDESAGSGRYNGYIDAIKEYGIDINKNNMKIYENIY